MKKSLTNMRSALHRCTLRARTAVAIACGVISAAIFGGVFMTSLHSQLTRGWRPKIVVLFDLLLPLFVMALSWLALIFSTRLILQRNFRDLAIPLRQKTGKIGLAMFGALALIYLVILVLAPAKPLWVFNFMPKG
jgi:hypothetical protein